MNKIVYYENILEFKKNTQSKLKRGEVNEWRLCRTCLSDADDSSADLFKLCIMGTDGALLNVRELFTITTGLQVHEGDELPLSICKDCLNKLSTFYCFKLQTERAEKVLSRLLNKLHEVDGVATESNLVETSNNEVHTTSDQQAECYADCSVTDSQATDGEEVTTALEFINSNVNTIANIKVERSEQEIAKQPTEEREVHEEEENLDEIISQENVKLLEVDYIMHKDETDEVEEEEDGEGEEEVVEIDYEQKDNMIVKSDSATENNMEEEYYLENEDDSSNNTEDAEVIMLELDDAVSVEVLDEAETGYEDNKSLTKLQIAQHVTSGESASSEISPPNDKKRKKGKMMNKLLANLNCTICGMQFRRQCLLVQHVQDKHPNMKAYKCRVCTTMFTHLQSLSRHMVTHKTVQYRNVCNSCGKAFLRTDDWKRHVRVHTGERPYMCGTCGKAFKQTNELKEHQNTHLKEKLFECNICGHRMSSRNGLYIHRKAHAGIKNYVCLHCDKRFLTNGELKSHTNVHLKKERL